jgi:small subunit ribosomal protein S17
MTEQTKERGTRKVRIGVVVSDKMTQTVTVQFERRVAHLVRIVETRPLSKTKRWRVVEIVKRAQ